MINNYNPFKENRAEQMRDLWKYYVPFPGLDGAGKPVVVEGGRGSGKTMFFQCNSWRQVLSQIRKNEQPSHKIFKDYAFIGIYYRVDTTFVSSMCDRENDRWDSVFETYFSICILKEILDLITQLRQDMPVDDIKLTKFINEFSCRFKSDNKIDNLEDFKFETDCYLDFIEDQINGVSKKSENSLRWVKAHRLISDICTSFNELFKKDMLFKIFIDEYETLQIYQQKIINTLIKHSTLPVIFNIGLRPKGMKTHETISKTETIEAPHDYEELPINIGADKYPEILQQICKKRIALGKEQGKIPLEASEQIEFYLGMYSIEDELNKIISIGTKAPHLKDLKIKILELGKEQELTESLIQEYITVLCDEAPILNSRLHYALLCKKSNYTPLLRELYDAYTTKSDRYSEWMHNRKFGLIFLLAKEFKKEKMYFGFDVFVALSSNIVRYFLELCEQAFRIAFLDNYYWDKPLAAEIQSEAAKYVSEYKVIDIAGYEPQGKELRIFIQYLGQIFYKLHTAPLTTLGEPEPNHFSTKDLSLPVDVKNLISSAIMWNVLYEGEPTKRKQSKLSPETVDYYMNKIYVPYFGISYRNQRKIQIDVSSLEGLLSGDITRAEKAFRAILKLPQEEIILGEISLFDQR